MKNALLVALFLFSSAFFVGSVSADDLGVIGPVYEITEQDMEVAIKNKLRAMEERGELDELNREMERKSREYMENPPRLENISTTTTPRTYYYDPTYVLEQDIKDASGNVLFPLGTKVNPLEFRGMSKHLVFFDGTDSEQVEWAKQIYEHYNGRVKLILVAGRILELMKDMQIQLYYDQYGQLTGKFGISHVPAIVSQENLQLRIDEIVPNENT